MRTFAIALALAFIAIPLAGCLESGGDDDQSPTAPSTPAPTGRAKSDSFDAAAAGGVPAGWNVASGTWAVEANATALSGPNVVRQSATDQKFPILVFDDAGTFADVKVETRFNVLEGEKAQAGGVVFRFVDDKNYYVARANGNEGNYGLFRLMDGNRQKVKEAEAPTGTHKWLDVRAEAKGSHIEVFSGDTLVFSFDETEAGAPKVGKVGIWTKDDSITLFDDFSVSPL